MTATINLHPALARDPALVAAMQERTGLRAVAQGRSIRLVGTPAWQGRPAPARAAEPRNGKLFALPDLLREVHARGGNVWLEDDRLKCNLPAAAVPAAVRRGLNGHTAELVQLIRAQRAAMWPDHSGGDLSA